jgi:IS30 family transposase
LVERTSGYLMRVKMNDATSAMEGFSAALNGMPLAMRKSMTYDQGREMAQQADQALYVAKHAGRNQVAIHRGD